MPSQFCKSIPAYPVFYPNANAENADVNADSIKYVMKAKRSGACGNASEQVRAHSKSLCNL
jgi:hypothetical protein